MPSRPHQRHPAQHRTAENTYVTEDQILPHLASLAILLADGGTADDPGAAHVTAPADAANLIDQLRGCGASSPNDPDTRTIRAAAVTTG